MGHQAARPSRAKEEVNQGSQMDPQDPKEFLAAARCVCQVGQMVDLLILWHEGLAQNGGLSDRG